MIFEMKIEASSCRRCGQILVPPRETCLYCGKAAGAMQMVSLDNKGIIISHTTLHVPPQGFSEPIGLALVKLDKEAMVLCLAEKEEEVQIDARVEVTLDEEKRFRYHVIR